ncbi:hypothetical protein AAFC00_002006 [Neodothiora populina]|uniref:Rhodopsin domain-containing protein n=1 Tax=Neodothiora populina TaxID=2781224 RepID=A0ABR3PG16_9PEZI
MFILGREETLSFDKSFQDELTRESWTMYALGMLFIMLRSFARIRRNGIKGLAPDDYLMWVAAGWYTILVVCLNVIAAGGGSNLYPPDEFDTFSPSEIKERIKGSKIVVLSEQSMLNMIYTLKVCMLFIYTRLTLQLKHQLFVKALAVYVAAGYVGTQLAFFLACRPFTGYWAMPPPNPQCTTLQNYAITQACFNISSDAFMLAISLPLLLNTTLPVKQKVVLVGIFGMGLFIIIAAILTKVFNLADLYSTVYMLWYVRESSVAVWVTNLPLIWPLLRETFPMLRSFTPGARAYSSSGHHNSRTRGLGSKLGFYGHGTNARSNTASGVPGGSSTTKSGTKISTNRSFALDTLRSHKKRGVLESSISVDSDERELTGNGSINGGKFPAHGGISTETTIDVEEHSLRNLESGESGLPSDLHQHGWERDPEDVRRYHVRIRGGDVRGDSVVLGSASRTPPESGAYLEPPPGRKPST